MKTRFAFLPILLLAVAAGAELKSWDRYQCIVDRAPFGPIYREDDPRFNSTPETTPTTEPVDEGPKLSDVIKLSAITVYGGIPAAGFTDSTDNKSYYLYQGKSAGDFTLVEVYADTKSILLRKGTQEEMISMTPKSPDEAPAPEKAAPAAVSAVPPTRPGRMPGYMERQRQRVEEERRKAREEARKKEEEEERKQISKRTAEEREKKLREYNMELIRTGNGRPLPIELNREELVQLGEEGFDVAEAIQALDEREAQPKEDRMEAIRRMREEARARREKEAEAQ